jgi:hypothetical protein
VPQLFSANPDLSLIKAAYLFRNCETYEVIEGEPFSIGEVVGPLPDLGRQADWKTLMSLIFLSHLYGTFYRWNR